MSRQKDARQERRKEKRKDNAPQPQVMAACCVFFSSKHKTLKHTGWSDELLCAAEAVEAAIVGTFWQAEALLALFSSVGLLQRRVHVCEHCIY